MALAPADERNLIFPLFAGLQTASGWDEFLARLLPRTGADRVCLIQRPASGSAMPALQREAWTGREPPAHPLDLAALEECGLIPLGALRPQRVYALEEMRRTGNDAAGQRQQRIMERERLRHARFVRFQPGTDASAWLILTHERRDFSAADSVLLSEVVPYLAVAIATLTQILTLQLRLGVAEEALAMLGIGQAVLDREGRVITADERAGPVLAAGSGALAEACSGLAGKPPDAREVRRLGETGVLLRPALRFGEASPRLAAATALIRAPTAPAAASSARVLAARFGLSAREAALATALCEGKSLIEAGEALRLTRETARNYSKRIYAKTGTRGQADLVRLILGDLAPFA